MKRTALQTAINPKKRIITKTIWTLSIISLFSDSASEMLYPVMPIFLQHIGFFNSANWTFRRNVESGGFSKK